MNAIDAIEVGKRYSLAQSPVRRLFDLVASPKRNHVNDFWALREVSFSVAQGESFGIIGANGSGKSTLLQILAGVMEPTSGSVQLNGRVSAILELGAGFNPEFSGRENARLNAAILGLQEAEIEERLPQIEEFAEIGDFIHHPVRTYSSGMTMRLAFSIAVHIDPQVLIVDEALAVGDIYFQQRCLRYLHRLRERGITLVFVSHAPGELRALCSRCLWLDGGRVRELGETDGVMSRYLAHALNTGTAPATESPPTDPTAGDGILQDKQLGDGKHRFGSRCGEVIRAELLNGDGAPMRQARAGDEIQIRVKVLAHLAMEQPNVGFLLRNERGETIYGTNSTREGDPLAAMTAGEERVVEFQWTALRFAPGRYAITVGIVDGTLTDFEVGDYIEDALELEFPGDGRTAPEGYLQLEYEVKIYRGSGSQVPAFFGETQTERE